MNQGLDHTSFAAIAPLRSLREEDFPLSHLRPGVRREVVAPVSQQLLNKEVVEVDVVILPRKELRPAVHVEVPRHLSTVKVS